MATHDYVLDNATGANFRADLNNALAAIVSNNSSSSEPSTKYAYQWWADTNDGVLKIRNSANDGWVTLLQLDGTLTLEDGTNSAPALGFITGGLGGNGINSPAANSLGFVAGGAVRGRFTADGLTFGSDTAAANALDDYEEGSWTPFYTTANNNLTLNGNASTTSSMYTTQGGSYIKIGRKVI